MISARSTYLLTYLAVSVALVSWSVMHSLERSFDFTTFLMEFTDGFKLGVLVNALVLLFFATNVIILRSVFGDLRLVEIEHLVEKLPIFAISLFFNLATNDNNLLLSCILLGSGISSKVFHIILTDRLDMLTLRATNGNRNSNVFSHFMLNAYYWMDLGIIVADFAMAKFLVYDVFQGINSVTCLLFGFLFAVQGVETATYFAKLHLSIYELYQMDEEEERSWQNKPYYSKGIDIASCSLKAISHLCFIYLLTVHSGLLLPLSMLQASKRLDTQLPTATEEELDASDILCIICREDMLLEQTNDKMQPKKLACGHILHKGCLKEWLERSDSCPLCRKKVFGEEPPQEPQPQQPQQQQDQPPQPNQAENPPPIVHNPEVLRRRLEEYTRLAAENALHREPDPTPDEPATIRLTDASIAPPDWAIFPLERTEGNYKVKFSRDVKGTLITRPKTSEITELVRTLD